MRTNKLIGHYDQIFINDYSIMSISIEIEFLTKINSPKSTLCIKKLYVLSISVAKNGSKEGKWVVLNFFEDISDP